MSTYLFIDAENVGSVDLSAVPDHVTVPYFHGAGQKSVSRQFHLAALKLGPRYVPIEVDGQAPDALDFHLALYLGRYIERDPRAEYVICSKDRGFDVLVKHLAREGVDIRQASSPATAFAPATPPETAARYERVLKLLTKVESEHRPRRRARLAAYLSTFWPKDGGIDVAEIDKLIDRLVAEVKITDTAGSITYHF